MNGDFGLVERRMKERFGDSVQLSSKLGVTVSDGVLSLFVNHPDHNMQTDGNAFEGWALAFHLLGYSVRLDWNRSVAEPLHYHRFLYRVERFGALFDWFEAPSVGSPPFLDSGVRKYLNHGTERATPPQDAESEAAYEERLYRSGAFHAMQDIEPGMSVRQLPVGLYRDNPPSEAGALFPGRGAAIDLCGIDRDGAFRLFELKRGRNYKVGAISEIFFYANIVDDVRSGKVLPSSRGRIRDSLLTWEAIRDARECRNYIVSDGLVHPIVRAVCESGVTGGFPLACIEECVCD